MHLPWVGWVLSEAGHEIIVAHRRKVRLIGENRKKDDRSDARTLARLARIGDRQLLCPVPKRMASTAARVTPTDGADPTTTAQSKLGNLSQTSLRSRARFARGV